MAQKKTVGKTKAEKAASTKTEMVFTKQVLVASRRYQQHADVLMAMLAKDKSYTIKETDAIIKKFMKGKVN